MNEMCSLYLREGADKLRLADDRLKEIGDETLRGKKKSINFMMDWMQNEAREGDKKEMDATSQSQIST